MPPASKSSGRCGSVSASGGMLQLPWLAAAPRKRASATKDKCAMPPPVQADRDLPRERAEG